MASNRKKLNNGLWSIKQDIMSDEYNKSLFDYGQDEYSQGARGQMTENFLDEGQIPHRSDNLYYSDVNRQQPEGYASYGVGYVAEASWNPTRGNEEDSNNCSSSGSPNPKRMKPNEREPGKGDPIESLTRITPETASLFYCDIEKVTFDMLCWASSTLQKNPTSSTDNAAGPPDHKWDHDHVRMPFTHPPNKLNQRGRAAHACKWDDRIYRMLNSRAATLHSAEDLVSLMMFYNESQHWNFGSLKRFLDNQPKDIFEIIGRMGRLAARIPELCPKSIPLLTKQIPASIVLSQKQIACLLCNGFFCTFPNRTNEPKAENTKNHRNATWSANPVPMLPSFNFVGLFKNHPGRQEAQQAKLQCLFNYFSRVTREEPDGCVTFERLVLKEDPFEHVDWQLSEKQFNLLHVMKEGFIEDDGRGMVQVDFANKRIGGGIIGRGCVQEEIRFAICPELIAARLFTEELSDNEALLITGCERYSDYTGYGDSFQFNGTHKDTTPRDSSNRIMTQVLAIDAVSYFDPQRQFEVKWVLRELKKAYCGFRLPVNTDKTHDNKPPAVATGNWGCGAFKGDRHLKSLIQLMAAAEAGRDLLYITIDDDQLVHDLSEVHKALREKEFTVGKLFSILMDYGKGVKDVKFSTHRVPLIEYVMRKLNPRSANDSNSENTLRDYLPEGYEDSSDSDSDDSNYKEGNSQTGAEDQAGAESQPGTESQTGAESQPGPESQTGLDSQAGLVSQAGLDSQMGADIPNAWPNYSAVGLLQNSVPNEAMGGNQISLDSDAVRHSQNMLINDAISQIGYPNDVMGDSLAARGGANGNSGMPPAPSGMYYHQHNPYQ